MDLVKKMDSGEYGMGAALDGDGDRNTILSARMPSSSRLATVSQSSPTTWSTSPGSRPLAKGGKGGVAMPTSGVLDRVAEKSSEPQINACHLSGIFLDRFYN